MNRRRFFAIEQLESRDTPSSMVLSTGIVASPMPVRVIEDPNIAPPMQVSAPQLIGLGHQPASPGQTVGIIAI